MLNDFDFDKLAKPVIELYNEMQEKLIYEIARRFITYETIGGTLEWQLRKLSELGALNEETIKIISEYSNLSEQRINEAIDKSGILAKDEKNLINLHEQGAFDKNPVDVSIESVMDLVKKETRERFSIVQSKAIESTKEAYIECTNTAYLDVQTGLYDYNTSIKRATKNIADKGITGATYTSGGKLKNYSIEAVVRRDIVTALNKVANKANETLANELGAKYYYISQHLGARNRGIGYANHESWQGIVTQIEGSSEEYPNHVETTGEGKVDGLGGANCRHHKSPYWPGFSVIPKKMSKEDNAEVTELLEKQRAYERRIRIYKRRKAAALGLDDKEGMRKADIKVKEYQNKLTDLIKDNSDILKRQSNREQTVLQR